MASGNGGQIALAKIGSLYTSVDTVNRWGNFVSESLEHTFDELEEGSITGRRDAPDSHKGIDKGAGDINIESNPNNLGDYLKAWFGTYVASTVTDAGSNGANSGDFAAYPQMWHKFTPRQSAFSDRTFLEPMNVMIYRDVGSAWLFKQAIFPTLKLDIQAGQLVKTTATLMARTVDRIERIAAIQSLVSSGGKPWVWDMTSVEVSTTGTASAALAAKTNFEQISITLDLPHEGVSLLDGTKKYGEFSPSDFRRVKIEGTMSFRDQDDYDTFVAYENRRMRLTMLNTSSTQMLGNPASLDASSFLGYPGLRIHIPKLKFLTWSAPIGGPNRLTASFTAKGEFDNADGMISMELMNIVSSGEYTAVY